MGTIEILFCCIIFGPAMLVHSLLLFFRLYQRKDAMIKASQQRQAQLLAFWKAEQARLNPQLSFLLVDAETKYKDWGPEEQQYEWEMNRYRKGERSSLPIPIVKFGPENFVWK